MDWPGLSWPVSLRRYCGVGTMPGFIYAVDKKGPPTGRRESGQKSAGDAIAIHRDMISFHVCLHLSGSSTLPLHSIAVALDMAITAEKHPDISLKDCSSHI